MLTNLGKFFENSAHRVANAVSRNVPALLLSTAFLLSQLQPQTTDATNGNALTPTTLNLTPTPTLVSADLPSLYIPQEEVTVIQHREQSPSIIKSSGVVTPSIVLAIVDGPLSAHAQQLFRDAGIPISETNSIHLDPYLSPDDTWHSDSVTAALFSLINSLPEHVPFRVEWFVACTRGGCNPFVVNQAADLTLTKYPGARVLVDLNTGYNLNWINKPYIDFVCTGLIRDDRLSYFFASGNNNNVIENSTRIILPTACPGRDIFPIGAMNNWDLKSWPPVLEPKDFSNYTDPNASSQNYAKVTFAGDSSVWAYVQQADGTLIRTGYDGTSLAAPRVAAQLYYLMYKYMLFNPNSTLTNQEIIDKVTQGKLYSDPDQKPVGKRIVLDLPATATPTATAVPTIPPSLTPTLIPIQTSTPAIVVATPTVIVVDSPTPVTTATKVPRNNYQIFIPVLVHQGPWNVRKK